MRLLNERLQKTHCIILVPRSSYKFVVSSSRVTSSRVTSSRVTIYYKFVAPVVRDHAAPVQTRSRLCPGPVNATVHVPVAPAAFV